MCAQNRRFCHCDPTDVPSHPRVRMDGRKIGKWEVARHSTVRRCGRSRAVCNGGEVEHEQESRGTKGAGVVSKKTRRDWRVVTRDVHSHGQDREVDGSS